jgi:putative ABC transport system ATP-binding protein
VNLTVEYGEWVAIRGCSGSGKSTLMNILGLLDLPTSGSYMLDGRDVSRLPERDLANARRESIGFVFQKFHLLPQQTALSNVELPMTIAGVPKRERKERALKALHQVGLAGKEHHRPPQLSGGQQQRVAIARAMVNRPTLLLADEPTGALDPEFKAEILDLFEKLRNDSGVTIVVVTHDEETADRADRVVNLVDGRLVTDKPLLREVV